MLFFRKVPKILKSLSEERIFLDNLDSRLHYIETKRDSRNPKIIYTIDRYHARSIEEKEMKIVLSLIGEKAGFDFALAPINTNFGLSVGFDAFYAPKHFSLLKFIESQLPRGYSFDSLTEYFMSEDNLRLHRKYGIVEPIPVRSKYKS